MGLWLRARLRQDLPPELAEQDGERLRILRVALEAGALEILDGVGLAIRELLAELLGQRVAELIEPAVPLPVCEEVGREVVAGLAEMDVAVPRADRLCRRAADPFQDPATELPS
jgi:hypothetical protein